MLGFFLLVVLPGTQAGEFNYASYSHATLENIIVQEQNHSYNQSQAKEQLNSLLLECGVLKYRVQCSYSNIRRPIPEKKKNVIILWMEMLRFDTTLSSLYQQEILVTEDSREYWMPIQEQLSSYMNQELVDSDTIELFIIYIGKIESEFVFITTEFDKSISLSKEDLLQRTASTSSAPLISDR